MSQDTDLLDLDALTDVCDRALAHAKEFGATAAEAYAEAARQTNANLEQNDVKGAQVEEHRAVGIRVFKGNREGYAYVNRLDEPALAEAVKDALAIAAASDEDPAAGILAAADAGEATVVDGLWNAPLANLDPSTAIDEASKMMRAALAVDDAVSIDSGSLGATGYASALVSTEGIRRTQLDASMSYGLFGMAVKGEDVGSFDYVYDWARSVGDIKAATLGTTFGERVMAVLNPVAATSYRGNVVFSADAFEEVFLSTILGAIDGDEVFKKRSRFEGKLGQKVGADLLTIIDDATLPGGLASASIDREGAARRRTPLVEAGVLQTYLYDSKSARRAGAKVTGHASGSARSQPGIGTANVTVNVGQTPEAELLKAADGGLYVGRFSGSIDPISGDFSGVAKNSFLIEDGGLGRPVRETLVAGNAFELLDKIVALGDRSHRLMSTQAPWALVADVNVTAGAADI